jgi:rhomboid protease GluP
MNMNALTSMRLAETLSGKTAFFTIYTLGGLAGSLASFALSQRSAVGASGAIMGVFGALWLTLKNIESVEGRYLRGLDLQRVQNSILQSVGLTLAIGLAIPIVDNWCATVSGAFGRPPLAYSDRIPCHRYACVPLSKACQSFAC